MSDSALITTVLNYSQTWTRSLEWYKCNMENAWDCVRCLWLSFHLSFIKQELLFTESITPLRAWNPPVTGNTCSMVSAMVASYRNKIMLARTAYKAGGEKKKKQNTWCSDGAYWLKAFSPASHWNLSLRHNTQWHPRFWLWRPVTGNTTATTTKCSTV